MATIVVRHLLLLLVVAKVDLRLSVTDHEKFSATINAAKAKLSSAEYFYIDDSSPGDYFDSIVSAAKVLKGVLNETSTSQVLEKRKVIKAAVMSLFQEVSSTLDEQAAPFGLKECWLLPAAINTNEVVPNIDASLGAVQENLDDNDGLLQACQKWNFDGSLKTLKALVGKDCREGDNYTIAGTIQKSMMRYAEEHQFGGGNENNCLHLFVARFTKSEEAVQMFKKSFDKYLLATVTIQSFCSPFVPWWIEDARRARLMDMHASFATSLDRTTSIQLNKRVPRQSDDSQQAIISQTKTACKRVKSTVASDTYFLGKMTAEEFENMTFEMADALTSLHKEVFWLAHNATMSIKAVFKGTLSALLDEMMDLATHLAEFKSNLSRPFGRKDDGLMPAEADCDLSCQERNVFSF